SVDLRNRFTGSIATSPASMTASYAAFFSSWSVMLGSELYEKRTSSASIASQRSGACARLFATRAACFFSAPPPLPPPDLKRSKKPTYGRASAAFLADQNRPQHDLVVAALYLEAHH